LREPCISFPRGILLISAEETDTITLAEDCDADPDALFRLLRGLASLGIFSETRPGHFSLTPLAELCGAIIRNPCATSRGCWGMSTT
jgi:hypothetical protein